MCLVDIGIIYEYDINLYYATVSMTIAIHQRFQLHV